VVGTHFLVGLGECRILIEALLNLSIVLAGELKVANERIKVLEDEVAELKIRINKDSHNSHNPPSSDKKKRYPDRKPSSTSKKSGAKPGHGGSNLAFTSTPDVIVTHKLKGHCNRCKTLLRDIKNKKMIKRQVVEVEIKKTTTEHQAESGVCHCGESHVAAFPFGVNAYVQYGESAKSLVSYFSNYQLIPYKRLEEIFKDIFNLSLCEETVHNVADKTFNQLSNFEVSAKEYLLESKLNHADETPVKVDKTKYYIHVLSNAAVALSSPHANRSKKALEDIGIIPNYKGFLCDVF